ncbi:MAG: hypothetical protein ACLFO1_05120 [Spirochaetaceae bacterium]
MGPALDRHHDVCPGIHEEDLPDHAALKVGCRKDGGVGGMAGITAFDPQGWGVKTHTAGEVAGIHPAESIGTKEGWRPDRFRRLALSAAQVVKPQGARTWYRVSRAARY